MNHADQPAEDLSADPEEGISHAWRHPKHADKLVNNHVALLQEEVGNMLFKKIKRKKNQQKNRCRNKDVTAWQVHRYEMPHKTWKFVAEQQPTKSAKIPLQIWL